MAFKLNRLLFLLNHKRYADAILVCCWVLDLFPNITHFPVRLESSIYDFPSKCLLTDWQAKGGLDQCAAFYFNDR